MRVRDKIGLCACSLDPAWQGECWCSQVTSKSKYPNLSQLLHSGTEICHFSIVISFTLNNTSTTSCPDLCKTIQHQHWMETKPLGLRKDMMRCELQEISSSPGPSLSKVSMTSLATCKVTEVMVISWMERSQQTQTEGTIDLQSKGCSISSERCKFPRSSSLYERTQLSITTL